MRRLLIPFLVFAVLPGCKKTEPAASAGSELLSQAKTALTAREKKLASFQYEGSTVQGEQRAEFAFAWRAPQKTRAEFKDSGLTFAFDGRQFTQWDPRTRVLTRVDLERSSRDDVALFLHQAFAPFVPEGWRTPLLAGEIEAKETEGSVELTARSGEVEVTYRFAPPAYDFAGKRVRGGGTVEVLGRHCDEALGLCFPREVREQVPGAPPALTTLTGIAINGPLPPETFELKAPEGARVETRTLDELLSP